MTYRILIMGLSGAGKTTLSKNLIKELPNSIHLNADSIRQQYNDWDFSYDGRIRQAKRMKKLSDSANRYTIIDFICPLNVMRDIIDANVIVWMNTITNSRYKDTDMIFESPTVFNIKFDSFSEVNVESVKEIINV